MVKFLEVSGFQDFEKLINTEGDSSHPVYVLFFAGPSDKESWCPDCNKAKPVIDEVVKVKASENSTFIHVNVGDRETWKNPECLFRTNKLIQVTNVPTLLKWNTKQCLKEEQCADKAQIESIL